MPPIDVHRTNRSRRALARLGALALLGLNLSAGPARAAETDWPSRPIRLVVPQAAGSANDVLARTLAEVLGQRLKQPVLVENRPGANGVVAASYVLGQPADGQLLFMAGVSNLAWNPFLYPRLTHDPRKDFAGVAVFAESPFITLVSPALGVNSLAELVAKAAKAEPPLSYASAGQGNSTHLAMALVAQRTGMKLQHVPFNGSGFMNTVMAGETPVMTTVPGGITELLRSGRLKGLAVTGETRLAELPEVPTFKELGLDISIPGWYSIVVRQGTPEAVIQRLNQEIRAAVQSPALQSRLQAQSLRPLDGPASEVARLTQRDAQAWGPFIRQLGITP